MNAEHPKDRSKAQALTNVIRSNTFSILFPGIVGAALAWLSVKKFESYGLVLFMSLPTLVAFLSGLSLGFRRNIRPWPAIRNGIVSLFIVAALIILFAVDGFVCLLMALPLALILAVPGAVLGMMAGRAFMGRSAYILPLVLIFLFPCLVAFEDAYPMVAPLRKVTTSVEIEAPVGDVWKSVVAFSKITAEPDGLFRLGIAYPMEDTIEGTGVGAVRRCKFCTGDFVEPITVWDENRLLAFDVQSSPPPMKEFSIYDHVDPPHLHGHMASEKGQFRLEQRGNKILLEGSTWYRHEMWPQWYWMPITDRVIHKIHHRVLDHIKAEAEEKVGRR